MAPPAELGPLREPALQAVAAGELAAVAEAKSVAEAAELDGDSTVYGMLGDVLTDLGDYAAAGAYYDKVLSMD